MQCLSRIMLGAATLLAASYTQPIAAAVDYALEAGVGHSDNIRRVADEEIEETIATAGVDLSWTETRSRLTADVNVNVDYFEYLDDTFDSDVVGTADGTLLFGIIPERFIWLLQDSFGQVISDPFAPVTPETRENVNYLTTGPDLTVRFGGTGFARVLGRYSLTDYERSPFDSERAAGGIGFGRRISAGNELSLNGLIESIDFDDPTIVDFDRENVFARYLLEGSRTDISIELGYTWLERQDGLESDGELIRVELSRRVSDASTVSLTAGSQLTDASDAMRTSIEGPAVGGHTGVISTGEPFDNQFATLTWSFTRNRTNMGLSVSLEQDEFQINRELDRSVVIWDASFDRRISRVMSAGLFASLSEEEFDTTGASTEELRAGITCSWQFGRATGLRLQLERFDRSGDESLGEFVEHRAFLTLFYSPASSTQ